MSAFEDIQRLPEFQGLTIEQKRYALSGALDYDIARDERFKGLDPNDITAAKDNYISRFLPEKGSYVQEERGLLGDIGSKFARGAIHAVEGIGGAMRMSDLDPEQETNVISETGKKITDFARGAREKYDILKPDVSEVMGEDNIFEEGIGGAAESILPSAVPFAGAYLGGKVGALVGSVVPGVGTIGGAAAGALIGGGLSLFGTFGAGEYQNTYDETMKAPALQALPEDKKKEVAKDHALVSSLAESLGEVVGDVAFVLSFGVLGALKPAMKYGATQTIKQLISPGGVKNFFKAVGKAAPFEVGSEMGTAYIQAGSAQKAGISDMSPLEASGRAILPSLLMSLTFGLAATGMQTMAARRTFSDLNSDNVDDRIKAAQEVGSRIEDDEVRNMWNETASDYIRDGKEIPLNEPLVDFAVQRESQDTILSTLDVALSSGDVTPEEVRESIPGLVESGIPREQIDALLEHHHKMMAQPEPEEIPSPSRTPEEQADDVIDEYAKAFEDVYGDILNPSRALPPGQGFVFYDIPERTPYSPELADELRRSRQQQALPPGQGFIFYDVPERAPYSPELAAELRRSRQQQALPPGQGFELVETPSESRRKGIPEGDKMRLKQAGATQKEIALVESGKATVDDILAKKKPIPTLQEEEIVAPAASGEAVEGTVRDEEEIVKRVDSTINARARSNVLVEEGMKAFPEIRLQEAEEAGRWAYLVAKGEATQAQFDGWKDQMFKEGRARKGEPEPVNAETLTEQPAKAKEPWEMTFGEWRKHEEPIVKVRSYGSDVKSGRLRKIHGAFPEKSDLPSSREKSPVAAMKDSHRQLVQQALYSGLPVPTEVLNDYPDLAKAEPQPAKPAEGTAALIEEDDATVAEVRETAVRNLVDMLKESSGGGFREFNEGGGWEREFVSSTPDWFKEITVTTEKGNKRKVSKNELLAAAKNIEKGKRLTDKQQEMWNQVEEIANAEMRSDYYQNLINEIELAKAESEELAREEIDERAAIQAEAYLEDEIQGVFAEEGIVEARQFQDFLDEWDSMTEEAKAYQKPTEPTLPPKGFKKTGLEQGNLITGKAEPIFEKLPEPERKKQIQTPMFENILGQEVPMMERKKQPDLDKLSESGVVYDHEETKAGNISDTRGGVAYRVAGAAGSTVLPRVRSQREGSYVVSSDRIRSSEEAAKIAQETVGQYADEHLLAIITDGNGKILKIHKSTIGGKISAAAHPEEYAALAMNTRGAERVVLVHNHPSGNPNLSDEDLFIEEQVNKLMQGYGIKAKIIAVTPHNFMLSPDGPLHKLPYYERVFVNVGENLPKGITSSEGMKQYVSDAGIDRGIILLNYQQQPLAVVSISDYTKLVGNQKKILARIDELNATTMVLVDTNKDLTRAEVANVKRFANAAGYMNLLDAIDQSGSWMERGMMPELHPKDIGFFRFPAEEGAQKGKRDTRDLIVTHNLTEANVLHALKMGGIPVPSLAVTQKGQSTTNFGEITLIGSKALVDPKGYAKSKVYGADIYSPRYPKVTYLLNDKTKKAIIDYFEPIIKKADPDGKYKNVSIYSAVENIKDNGIREGLAGTNGVYLSYMHEAEGFVNKDGATRIYRPPVDNQKYLEWVDSIIDKLNLSAEEKLFQGFTYSGNRRYRQHTLENVVSMLKKDLRGGEGFNYGVGSLRAKFTPQFKNVAEIKKEKGRLVSEEKFKKVKEEINDEFFKIVEDLRPYSPDKNEVTFTDTVIAVMEEAATRGVPRSLQEYRFTDVPTEIQAKVAEFLKKLRSLPTQYFEAKILRGVEISEFSAAVVPSDTSQKVKDALTSRGLRVAEYTRGNDEERQAVVNDTATEIDSEAQQILFSIRQDADDFEKSITVADLQKLATEVNTIFKRSLPTDVYRRVHIRLKPFIEIPSDVNVQQSLEQWGADKTTKKPVGMTQFYKDFSALVELAYNVPSDTITGTAYHELFHVASSWLLPEKDRSRVLNYYKGNEENAAEAFKAFAQGTKAKQPDFITRIFTRLNKILQRIKNALTGKGYFTPEDVFTKIMVGGYRGQSKDVMAGRMGGGKLEVGAWHGGPYAFDKFNTEKIGTGEGAQSFGWGLYFTELEDVAKHYAEQFGSVTGILDVVPQTEAEEIVQEQIQKGYDELGAVPDRTTAVDWISKDFDGEDGFYGPFEMINAFKALEKRSPGSRNLYKVTLHKGKKPGEYTWLDWEKTVPDEIKKKVLRQANKENVFQKTEIINYLNGKEKDIYGSGEHFYKRIAKAGDMLLGEKSASEFLLRAGIDGIRYPSGTLSGIKDSDKYNYVVFDENAVTIEEHAKFAMADQDTAYLDAVKRGDMETAQKMVDEAAKRAGYYVERAFYHGTPNKNFTVFEPNLGIFRDSKSAFVFTDKESVANEFRGGVWIREAGDVKKEYPPNSGVFKAYLDLTKVDEWQWYGGSYNENDVTDAVKQAKRAKKRGVVFHNMRDGSYTTAGQWPVSNIVFVFNPSQIKSADPVTYDDQGNVIPLSQRFNPEVADIRFAMETTLAGTPESQALLKKLKSLEKKGRIDPGRTLKALEKYESLVQTLKDDKKDIFAKQKALEDHIKEHLEGPDRYRVLSYIKNIAKPSTEKGRQTMLKKGIERVAAVHEKVEKQNAITGIKEILKKKQPRRDSKRGITTGKQMTNEGHKMLEKIKTAFYTPEVKAENKIQSYADRWDKGTLTDEEREELIIMVKYGSPLTKSASELNAALEDLEALVSGERMKWQAEEEARKAEFGKNRTQLHEELSYGQEKKRPDQLAEERQNKGVFGKILDAARSFDDMSQSWEMLLDKLARYYKPSTALKSPITETYREKVFNATIGEHSSLAAHQELIRDKAREIYGHRGLARRLQKNTEIKKNTGVTRVYEGKRVELSLSQNMAYKLWQLFQQPSIQEEMNERGYDATTLSQVEKYLDPKVKEWAKWQIEEFYPMYREGANEVYKKLFYIDMADIEGYSPVSRIYAHETADEALLRDIGPMMSSILPSAVKARVKNARDFNILDGDSVLFKHIVQMEHFKAWGETMRELRSVFGVEPTQAIISQYHGATANRVVQDFLNRFARGGQDRALTLTALDKMRSNFTRGVIGANPVVFLKQLTSIPAYAMEIPTHRFVSGTSYALSHPIKVYKTLMQSEAMKARYKVGWERDVVLAMQRASIKSLSHAQSFSDMMMLSTKLGDKLAIIAGGWSVYSYHLDKLKKQGMNHEDAHKKALYQFDIATKRAQQAGDIMDMAYLQEHGGSLGKWFTMFMTAPLAYYRNSSAALRNIIAGRKGEYTGQNLKRFVTSWALLQMMFQFVASGFEWDDKEMLRAALIGPLNGLFVIRDITETLGMALIEGERPWQSIGVPPPISTFTGPMAKAALRAHKNTMEDDWDLEEFLKFADDFSKAIGQITGVPVANITRVAKGIKAVAEGDTEKPVRRAMGYSAYALNEKGK